MSFGRKQIKKIKFVSFFFPHFVKKTIKNIYNKEDHAEVTLGILIKNTPKTTLRPVPNRVR